MTKEQIEKVITSNEAKRDAIVATLHNLGYDMETVKEDFEKLEHRANGTVQGMTDSLAIVNSTFAGEIKQLDKSLEEIRGKKGKKDEVESLESLKALHYKLADRLTKHIINTREKVRVDMHKHMAKKEVLDVVVKMIEEKHNVTKSLEMNPNIGGKKDSKEIVGDLNQRKQDAKDIKEPSEEGGK